MAPNKRVGTANWEERQYDLLAGVLNSSDDALRVEDANATGTWSYYAGVSGTVNVTAGQRVLMISGAAGGAGGATMSINGGAAITIPTHSSLTIEPSGVLTAPTIVFTNTTAYFIEVVS